MSDRENISTEFSAVIAALEKQGFSVEGQLGRGGVGVVFSATRDGAELAVKVPFPWPEEVLTHDPASTMQRLRFQRLSTDGRSLACVPATDLPVCARVVAGEAARLAEVTDDPGVVHLREKLTVNGRAAYSMNRVSGSRLALKPAPLAAMAKVLQRLHGRNWGHGDLKPENARLADDGTVTLIDPLPIGSDLLTPEWSHLNFLVASPLVDSADPRDRKMVLRHRDHVAVALMASEVYTGQRPWGHREVADMLDRSVTMGQKREALGHARERLVKVVKQLPAALRPYISLALEPGIWPEEGPIFAAYLQARPFETRCDALCTLDIGALFAEAVK